MKPHPDTQERIKDALELMLGAMCEHTKDLTVRLSPSQKKPIYTITCHTNDYGRICGKQAAMLMALRTLANTMAAHDGLAAEILLDEEGCVGEKTPRGQFAANPEWDSEPLDAVLQQTLPLVFGAPVTVGYDTLSHSATKVTVFAGGGKLTHSTAQVVEQSLAVLLKTIGVNQGRLIHFELL